MKIIGVYGGSGAGKSTVSKKIAQLLPKSLVISADLYMMDFAQKLEPEIFERLKVKKEQGVFSSNYFFESFENQKIFVDVIKVPVIELIKERIVSDGNDKDYIIIDWVFLPMCSLFSECDLTICVTADYNIRLERLEKRLKDETVFNKGWNLFERYKPGILEKRIKYTTLNEYGYNATYEIVNNGEIEKLEEDINKLSINIINYRK